MTDNERTAQDEQREAFKAALERKRAGNNQANAGGTANSGGKAHGPSAGASGPRQFRRKSGG